MSYPKVIYENCGARIVAKVEGVKLIFITEIDNGEDAMNMPAWSKDEKEYILDLNRDDNYLSQVVEIVNAVINERKIFQKP